MAKTAKSGIIMKINEESGYAVIAGSVARLSEGEKGADFWYCVRLSYEVGKEMKETDIYFWNDSEADDYRRYQADRAKQKNLQEGNAIVVRCRFRDDSKKEATGYGIYYNGLIRIRPDTEHEKDDRSVLAGTVTAMKDVIVRGQDALRLNVYAGRYKNPDGDFLYKNVWVTLLGDQAAMARTDLAEKDLGNGIILRKKAVFRCGAIRVYYIPTECPICLETALYQAESGKMICPECGAEAVPEEKNKRENVFGFDYIVTEEREMRR